MPLKYWKPKLKKLVKKIQMQLDHWLPILPIHLSKASKPKGHYASTKAWINKLKFFPGSSQQSYLKVYSSLPIERSEPGTIDAKLYWKFRLNHGNRSSVAFVATIPGGRFWSNCAVISPDNQLLADISLFFRVDPIESIEQHPVFWKEIQPLQHFQGTVAVLAAPGGNTYFHWLVEVLPRIHLLQRGAIAIDSIDHFIVNGTDLPFQQQTLEFLNIPREKRINGSAYRHVSADRLIVPSLPRHQACNIGKWVFNFLQHELRDKIIAPKTISTKQRLYISRAKARRRRVTNESEVTDFLERFGFQTIYLEDLSFVEQVRALTAAEYVVAPHGAGLANIVFCLPGTTIIEMFSPNYVGINYWNICTQIDLNYYYLFGEGERPEDYVDPQYLTEDILIRVESLKRILELAKVS